MNSLIFEEDWLDAAPPPGLSFIFDCDGSDAALIVVFVSGMEILLTSDIFKSSKFLAAVPEFLLMLVVVGLTPPSRLDLLGRGNFGESAMDLFGACNCLETATEVWGAVTVLNVAMDDLVGA